MGTNFYMLTTDKSMVEKYAPYTYNLTDDPYFAYEIHVAKTSMGWLPLFQAHDNGIRSVKQYKEFFDTGEVRIFDEYGDEYTWAEFNERVLQFNGGRLGVNKPEKIKKTEDELFTKWGIKPDTSMPDYTPVSHLPGSKQSYKYMFESDNKSIFADEEGYEFEELEFS